MPKNKNKEIIIQPNATILEGLKKMDYNRRKLLLVHDGIKYLGLLSIGDIQRAIIKGIDISSPVSMILRTDNIVALSETPIVEIKKLMMAIRAEFMPVVSNENELLSVYFWEDLFIEKEIARRIVDRNDDVSFVPVQCVIVDNLIRNSS